MQSRTAHGYNRRHKHGVIPHFTYTKTVFAAAIQFGKHTFTEKVEIKLPAQQPFGYILELCFKRIARLRGIFTHALGNPRAFRRVHHSNVDHGNPARERRIQSGKMILYVTVFTIPTRLIIDTCGIIALCRTAHTYPCQVGNPKRYAERGLPIALKFVPAEIEFPTAYAILLTHHAFSAALMRHGLCLLRRSIFFVVTKHIDTGNRKLAIMAHSLSYGSELLVKQRFVQHMPRKSYPVPRAPFSDFITVRFRK